MSSSDFFSRARNVQVAEWRTAPMIRESVSDVQAGKESKWAAVEAAANSTRGAFGDSNRRRTSDIQQDSAKSKNGQVCPDSGFSEGLRKCETSPNPR